MVEGALANLSVFRVASTGVEGIRQLILDRAMRGRLVEQNPADESAAELLQRITMEAPVRRKVQAQEVPRPELPLSWEWVPLPRVLAKLTDGTHHSPPNGAHGEFMYVTAKNIKPSGVALDDITYVSRDVHDQIADRCDPALGDVLYIKDGATTGVVTVNQLAEPFSMLSSVALLKPSLAVLNWYLVWCMRSPMFYDAIRRSMKGAAITRVTLGMLGSMHIPLPPLAEQHRIVAAVEDLMRRCDDVEMRELERRSAADSLRRRTLNEVVVNPSGGARFWSELAGVWDNLVFDRGGVQEVRNVILDLGIQGRLVPQDDSEEPANALIDACLRIRNERVASGMTRLVKQVVPAPTQPLPAGWSWAAMQDIVQFIDYRGKTPAKTAHGVRLVTAKNIKRGYVSLEPREFVSPQSYASWMTRGLPAPGDVLFTTEAPLGHAAIVEAGAPFALAQRTINFAPYGGFQGPYLMWLILSPWCQQQLRHLATGMTATGVKAARLRQMYIPLPPRREQQRIVARITDLMAACDQADAALEARAFNAERLSVALTARA